jgi:hypothetical protein
MGLVRLAEGPAVMSRLSRVIAPMLHAAGLDVRPVSGANGELHELIITNPRQPSWGRVVIDRDGRTAWNYWGDAVTDAGAASIATVVIAIMAADTGHQAGRDPRATRPQASAERARPHS